MAGMYPNNQTIEIFGEQVSWPGVDATGKFTDGSFSNPLVKPSYIPAATINLIIDNLESIIKKYGGTPNATDKAQIANFISSTPDGFGLYSEGRDLRLVFGITSTDPAVYIPLIMAELRRRCNNNGEINNTKVPYFYDIEIGDYIDGMNLSGINGTTGQVPVAWNNTYKNNRIIVMGFNPYKNIGDEKNTKNHILFGFRNLICNRKMNSVITNTGGYQESELRNWLEGADGDGNGEFADRLKTALGGNYLYTIRKRHTKKDSSTWNSYTVFLPTEIEVFGYQTCGDELANFNTNVHIPIFTRSFDYLIKNGNGTGAAYWLHTPLAANATHFLSANGYGGINPTGMIATMTSGVSPIFPVA